MDRLAGLLPTLPKIISKIFTIIPICSYRVFPTGDQVVEVLPEYPHGENSHRSAAALLPLGFFPGLPGMISPM